MKALKSSLAKDLLADPRAKGQLRSFLAAKSSQSRGDDIYIEVQQPNGQTLRVTPTVVAKAA